MDGALGGSPERPAATARGAAEATPPHLPMTAVTCRRCGASYRAPVTPRIVHAIRGCARCGRRALVVVGLVPSGEDGELRRL